MARHPLDDLTPREREVLALIAKRRTNGDIADELGISFDTAKSHVSNILSKLGVDTREEAAAAWRDAHSVRARVLAIPAALLHATLLQRALIGVAAIAGVGGIAVGIGVGTGTIGTSSPPTITVPLSELKRGESPIAVKSTYTGHDYLGALFPIWVARQSDGSITAFLGRDPHSGCPVAWKRGPFVSTNGTPSGGPSQGFTAECTGWIFLIDGSKYFGASPRGLDGYVVTVAGNDAIVHLDQVILGKCSDPSFSPGCSLPGAPVIVVTPPPSIYVPTMYARHDSGQ